VIRLAVLLLALALLWLGINYLTPAVPASNSLGVTLRA
jgi:hypothetical protein